MGTGAGEHIRGEDGELLTEGKGRQDRSGLLLQEERAP